MSTFLLIIKILPWALTLLSGGGIAFYSSRVKWLDKKFDENMSTIKNLKGIVLSQGEQIEKQGEIINEMLIIQEKYEKKKGTIKSARSATKMMEELNGNI